MNPNNITPAVGEIVPGDSVTALPGLVIEHVETVGDPRGTRALRHTTRRPVGNGVAREVWESVVDPADTVYVRRVRLIQRDYTEPA